MPINNHYYISRPAAGVARGIENLLIVGKNSNNYFVKASLHVTAGLLGLTIFPAAISAQLCFRQLPKSIKSYFYRNKSSEHLEKYMRRADKLGALALGVLATPLSLLSPDAISSFFLRRPPNDKEVTPFGVETLYGRRVDMIYYPKNVTQVQELIKKANAEKKQISVIGGGMSQGTQTVPAGDNHIVIHTKHLNKFSINKDAKTIQVQSGTTSIQAQSALNDKGLSLIVQQASTDPFTFGGMLGINAHGWAHDLGSVAHVVESIDVITADGELRHITRESDKELFGCMFGTLGWFGFIVGATIRVTENEHLIEKMEEVDLDDYIENYLSKIQGKDILLFGGRLVLDTNEGDPFRKVCMLRYEHDLEANAEAKAKGEPVITPNFHAEAKYGTKIQRIFLQILSHVGDTIAQYLISWFWKNEEADMMKNRKVTRNEVMHPPINAFKMLHHSNLRGQWLQEYFIKPENVPNFMRFLGAEAKANNLRDVNATLRPCPKDAISVLPYAEQDRQGVVICFDQLKTDEKIAQTRKMIENITAYLVNSGDKYYQAYMPIATPEQFESCYGKETLEKLRELKWKYDPNDIFGNAHTNKYFALPARTERT